MLLGFVKKNAIHKIVGFSLSKSMLNDTYKQVYMQIIEKLIDHDTEDAILECTEISLAVKQSNVFVPVLNTTTILSPNAFEAI